MTTAASLPNLLIVVSCNFSDAVREAVLFFVTKITLYENLKFSSNTTYRAKTSGHIVTGGVAVRAALEDW